MNRLIKFYALFVSVLCLVSIISGQPTEPGMSSNPVQSLAMTFTYSHPAAEGNREASGAPSNPISLDQVTPTNRLEPSSTTQTEENSQDTLVGSEEGFLTLPTLEEKSRQNTTKTTSTVDNTHSQTIGSRSVGRSRIHSGTSTPNNTQNGANITESSRIIRGRNSTSEGRKIKSGNTHTSSSNARNTTRITRMNTTTIEEKETSAYNRSSSTGHYKNISHVSSSTGSHNEGPGNGASIQMESMPILSVFIAVLLALAQFT